MSNIFADPIPFNTVFTSEKDVEVAIIATDGTVEQTIKLAKATALSFVHSNSAGIQRFAGEIIGRTYSGNKSVSGSIAGMFLDESMFRLVVGSKGSIQTLNDLIGNINYDEFGLDDRYQFGGLVIRFLIDKNKLRGYTTNYRINSITFDSYGFNLPSVGRLTQSTRFIGSSVDVEYNT